MGPPDSQFGINERRLPRENFASSTAVSDSAVTHGISSDSEADLIDAAKKKLAREMKERKEKKEAKKKSSTGGKVSGPSSSGATSGERKKLKDQMKKVKIHTEANVKDITTKKVNIIK